MNETRTSPAYAGRFQRVCLYIERHLDEPLSLETLSAIAHSSPYHFHRQFTACSGVPLYRYIQWLRLRRATTALWICSRKVSGLSIATGYRRRAKRHAIFRCFFVISTSCMKSANTSCRPIFICRYAD